MGAGVAHLASCWPVLLTTLPGVLLQCFSLVVIVVVSALSVLNCIKDVTFIRHMSDLHQCARDSTDLSLQFRWHACRFDPEIARRLVEQHSIVDKDYYKHFLQ